MYGNGLDIFFCSKIEIQFRATAVDTENVGGESRDMSAL